MGFVKEFKEFAFKGNVIDLAVGVIIGAAFGKIVTSLVEDVITPLLLNPTLKAAGAENIAKLTEELEEVKNLPNNRIVDNQYQKMVDQKNNYLLGQPFSIQTNNETYAELLKNIFITTLTKSIFFKFFIINIKFFFYRI